MRHGLFTAHAQHRCRTRSIRHDAVEAVLDFGYRRLRRGAEIYTLRWRDVRHWEAAGYELSRYEGVEVVCSHDGRIITVYRNRNPRAVKDRRTMRRAA